MNLPQTNPRPPAIPGYTFESLIGRGGMGVVWKAHQQGTNRPVAVKMILSRDFPRVEHLVRFQLEAELISQVQDPHIVQVFHTGEADGLPYLVMEFVGGGTLADRMRTRSYTPRQAAEMVLTIARAMGQVHRKGIVHRDLKPANVLMTEGEQPKVGDFGLARALAREVSDQSQSRIMGTVEYMSPEQARGGSRLREIAAPADVFALGVIFFELLTGQLPFHSDSQLETLNLVAEAKPRQPRTIRKSIPRDLETICLKCLRKDARGRYADGGELAEDLDRYLGGRSIRARHVGRAERAWLWCLRNPLATALIASALVGAVLANNSRVENTRRIEAELKTKLAEANELTLATEARAARSLADERQRQGEENLYFGTLTRAYQEYHTGNLKRSEQLLESCRPAPGRPDLRGWEWHHLRRRLNSDLVRIDIDPDAKGFGMVLLPALAFSQDGKRLVLQPSLSISLPDAAADGLLRFRLDPFLKLTNPAVVSPDERFFARIGKPPSRIWLFDRDKPGVPIHELLGHSANVLEVAFGPDGRRLASLASDGAIRVWDVGSGRTTGVLDLTGPGRIEQGKVAFAPDEKAVAVLVWRGEADGKPGAFRRELTVWDVGETKPRFPALVVERSARRPSYAPLSPHRLAFSPDASRIAVAAHDRTIRLVDTRTSKVVGTLTGHSREINCLAYFPDGRRLASGAEDHTIRIWDLEAESDLPIIMQAHDDEVTSLAIHPDGRRFASYDGSQIKIWSLDQLQGVTAWRDKRERSETISLNPDGELLLRGGINEQGELKLRKVRNGKLVGSQPYPLVDHAVFSPDGMRIAVATHHGILRGTTYGLDIWDGTLRVRLHSFKLPFAPTPFSPIRSMAFTPDGRRIAIVRRGEKDSGELWICDPETGRMTTREPFKVPQAPKLVMRPDGTELIVSGTAPGDQDESWFFDLHAIDKPPRRERNTRVLGFSRDGTLMARLTHTPTGFFSGDRYDVVDVRASTIAMNIPEPYLEHFGFDPAGKRIVTVAFPNLMGPAGKDPQHITLWDIRSGREILELSRDLVSTSRMMGVFFSPDGQWLILPSTEGELFLWDGRPLPELWPPPSLIKAEPFPGVPAR
ncbi:MAG: hypothetical protein JWN86_307 [Planctomycetota bacterium]|nr:hypothetical protein [Planctomycetota bacterium]